MATKVGNKAGSKGKTAAKKTLVIVESPSKAKTISRYLGSRYKVVASVGHVRDLPKSKLGIDLEQDFEPNYINIRGKGDIIRALKKEASLASKVYLATDQDREGEAISWHLAYLLNIDADTPCRIEFHEITKNAVKEAIKNPRTIDMKLVDAQQARRVLDRLVGYQISPLLWRKIRRGLSAGRVQSAALKIICDREEEIRGFVPEEYWTITADFDEGGVFTAKLAAKNNKKVTVRNQKAADEILAALKEGDYTVGGVETKTKQRKPQAPFTTSTLQQDAANKLNFNTRKTMQIAQQLYEGVNIKGEGTMGLVTYIRTDSVRISDEAKTAAKNYITERYGAAYWHSNTYTNKKKEVQDAHEAIRPSRPDLSPEAVKESLTSDQYKLYRLIWNRFTASQMAPMKYEAQGVDIHNGIYTLRATGTRTIFDGFTKVYATKNDDGEGWLPPLAEGQHLDATGENAEQNFTQPPARYTEASLVKELEDKDIGRPSTYAPIVSTLVDRKYIKREKKTLVPTELGETVNDMMKEYFHDIVDSGFTAKMEDRLDDVETEGIEWKSVIRDFYGGFAEDLKVADEKIEKVVVEDTPTDEICELCGKPMVIRHGRFGEFLACSGFPDCKHTRPIVREVGVNCPVCGKPIVQRRSARGRVFYGCSGYPDCQNSYWKKPSGKMCPDCGSMLVEQRAGSDKLECSNKECKYKE
jgi:DNA topoisomerase-1